MHGKKKKNKEGEGEREIKIIKANRNKKKVTKKQIALVDPGSERRRGKVKGVGGERKRMRRAAPSDRQRHEAVVLLDVTFEYV